jgi:uncharacterized protein YdiU (UPF0061 family)
MDIGNFEAIWNLATCTPAKVHYVIAWYYPVQTGTRAQIPDEMLERMSTDALEALAFRGCEPLLKRLEATPEKFDKWVHDAAARGVEDRVRLARRTQESGRQLNEFREALDRLRVEMRERFDELASDRDLSLRTDGLREELDELREEFAEFRTEMRELFEALERQIAEGASRRRGFFR